MKRYRLAVLFGLRVGHAKAPLKRDADDIGNGREKRVARGVKNLRVKLPIGREEILNAVGRPSHLLTRLRNRLQLSLAGSLCRHRRGGWFDGSPQFGEVEQVPTLGIRSRLPVENIGVEEVPRASWPNDRASFGSRFDQPLGRQRFNRFPHDRSADPQLVAQREFLQRITGLNFASKNTAPEIKDNLATQVST